MPKKKGNKKKNKTTQGPARPLLTKDVDQEYGLAKKALGNRRFIVYCYDGKERICKIRGSMRRGRQNRVNIDDHVLVCLRDFDVKDEKGDIIHRYNPDEVRKLKKDGELEEIKTRDGVVAVHSDDDDDIGFEFDEI